MILILLPIDCEIIVVSFLNRTPPPHTHTPQPVGQALIYALSSVCGDKFTPEAQDAWIALYSVVQYYMTLGMTEGLDA